MKFSKLLTFSIAGFIALSVVVLTARQVTIKSVAEPYLAIVNAKVVDENQQPLASAMLLKDDKILMFGNKEMILNALPVEGTTLDMMGKTIAPGKVAAVTNLEQALLSKGITTAEIEPESLDDATDYYWGRQHGWYDVRVQLVDDVALAQDKSDHLFFVGVNHPNRALVGKLTAGGFADFQVLSNGQLEQTWLGGVKLYQVQ